MSSALVRANAGFLLRHPWQLGVAIAGICIGVAVIVAVDLATASARKAFLLSMDAVTGEATHQIIGGPAGLDEALYVRLRVREGMDALAPVVEGEARINGIDLTLLGLEPFAEGDLRTLTGNAVAATDGDGDGDDGEGGLIGEFITADGAMIMTRNTAATLDAAAGEAITVTAAGQDHQGYLAGYFENAEGQGPGDVVAVDIATAQAWLNMRGRLTRIDVRLDPDDAEAIRRLESVLTPDAALLSAAGRTRSTAEMSDAFMVNLTAMSLLALLVALFLIYNSVSFSVLQRRHLIGVQRALGVTRGQIIRLVIGEAAAMGVAGALIGVLGGYWLAEQLLVLVSRSINDFYFRVQVTEVSLSAASLAKGIIAGVGATLAAATLPALEAGNCPPGLAMRRSALEHRSRSALPGITAAGAVAMLLAGALIVVSGQNLVAGLAAVFMLILGFALFIPMLVRTAADWLTPPARRLGGASGVMAVQGVARGLSRTAVSVVALAVAVSATVGVSTMVSSFRSSVDAWLSKALQADLYLDVPGAALDPGLLGALEDLEGVASLSTSRRVWVESEGGRTRVLAIRMAPRSYAGTEILAADPDEVWRAFEQQGAVLVSEPYAYRNGISPGDSVALRTDSGRHRFPVAAAYQSFDINASAVMMSRTTYERFWSDDAVDAVGLYLEAAASGEEVMRAVNGLAEGVQTIRVSASQGIRELSLAIFDRTFLITDILYWLAVGVAFIGILGAMLALQLERGRELAVMRALGMTPAQLGGMITGQTGVMGMLSGLAALPLGLLMAFVLIEVVNRRAFGWQIAMDVEGSTLLWAVLLAVLTAILGGLYPAWRAAHSRPAAAMREE